MADNLIKEHIYTKARRARIPVSGTFKLTAGCNLNCQMCYIHNADANQDYRERELRNDDWLRLGKKASDAGMIYLLLTGGEPTIRPDFIELYQALVKMGLVLSINTNGTNISPHLIDTLKKYQPEKINVSLYGCSDSTYQKVCGKSVCSEVLENIRVMKRAGLNVNITTTFTALNIDDMDGLIGFAKTENIPIRMSAFIFPPLRGGIGKEKIFLPPEELGKAAAEFDLKTMNASQLAKRREQIQKCIEKEHEGKTEMLDAKASACMAGKGAFWISWDGYMYPCGMISDNRCDVRKMEFEDAWKTTCSCMENAYLHVRCSECAYRMLCPSCAAVNISEINIMDLCERTKAYVNTFMNYDK